MSHTNGIHHDGRGSRASQSLHAKLPRCDSVDTDRLEALLRAPRLQGTLHASRGAKASPAPPPPLTLSQSATLGKNMTVALYKSVATGAREIVVQTNAQSLDVFITGLADALETAMRAEPEQIQSTVAATLRNAFPIAFAIAGYKVDKVTESKLLTCGFASPDVSELVAQSHV